jgi:predicted nucleic acid-binding Zn ribbon protein
MMILDVEATFVKLDKLRERMDRLEKAPDTKEWQYTRNLIQALTEGIAKSKSSSVPFTRKVRVDAPAAVSGDWQELVEVLRKKGIKSESKKSALKRE